MRQNFNLPMKVLGQIVLPTLGAMLALVIDGGAILLLEVILEALLTPEESSAVLAVGPGFEGTEAEFPAPSAALCALVFAPI